MQRLCHMKFVRCFIHQRPKIPFLRLPSAIVTAPFDPSIKYRKFRRNTYNRRESPASQRQSAGLFDDWKLDSGKAGKFDSSFWTEQHVTVFSIKEHVVKAIPVYWLWYNVRTRWIGGRVIILSRSGTGVKDFSFLIVRQKPRGRLYSRSAFYRSACLRFCSVPFSESDRVRGFHHRSVPLGTPFTREQSYYRHWWLMKITAVVAVLFPLWKPSPLWSRENNRLAISLPLAELQCTANPVSVC